MGDLNAKIGKPKKEEYLIMKPNGFGKRNARCQKFIDFAIEHKIAIMNTFFKKKTKNKWTWISPDKKYKNEIGLDFFFLFIIYKLIPMSGGPAAQNTSFSCLRV